MLFFFFFTTNTLKHRCTKALRVIEDALHPTLTLNSMS